MALPALRSMPAGAEQRAAGLGPRITLPSHSNHFSWERGHGFKRGFPGVWIVERETVREIVREAPPPPAAVPLPQNSGGGDKERKPYVVGSTYASLPGGCMKMVELAASYYFCGGGEWYRQEGKRYRAVARKL